MTDKEIMNILRKDKKDKEKMLKKLVEEKVKRDSKEKFSIQDIDYYSKYFNISMNELLLEILEVNRQDYVKFTKGYIKQISSEKFSNSKDKYICKKKNIFKRKINWNMRNYYNRELLLKNAQKLEINILDFATNILGKSKKSVRRVIKDKNARKRLYIGKYVNAELPMNYIENNKEIIMIIIKRAVSRAIIKLGVKFSDIDYEDEIQKALIYINYNGNNLDKYNQPIINTIEYKKQHGKTFSNKVFFYEINEIKIIKMEFQYQDSIKYEQMQNYNGLDEVNSTKEFIEKYGFDGIYARIIKKLSAGYTLEEILEQENIDGQIYKNIMEKMKQKIKLYENE